MPIHHRLALRILVAVVILVEASLGFMYAVNTPRWEAPDEPAQFNYIKHIAETGTLPALMPGDYDQAFLEKIKAEKFPPSLSVDAIRYESYEPPLYYLIATPFYLLAVNAGIDAVLALRTFSVALGVLLLLIAYQVLVQLFPSDRLLTLAGLGFMATVPMHIAMSAAVNADTFAEVLVALMIFLSIARLQGGVSGRRFILLGGFLYGLILLSSIKMYASGLLLIVAEWQLSGGKIEVRGVRTLASIFGLSLLLSIWWFARNALLYGGIDIFGLARHDSVVVGQPTTAEWISKFGLKNVIGEFLNTTFRSFWAQFGWMGVLVNDRIYLGLLLLTLVAGLGLFIWVYRNARERSGKTLPGHWLWGLLAAWVVVVLVDYVVYNLHYFQPQGRYLFPALVPMAAFAVVGLNEILEKRYVPLVFGLLYLVMLGLDYVSLFWFIVPQLRG